MRRLVFLVAAAILLVNPFVLAAHTTATAPGKSPADDPGDGSPVQISWGQMQADMDEQEVTVTRYGGGEAHMTVSYQPFFFQYFPVWAEVSVVQSPSWLTVSPSQTTFPLQQGETKTDDIALALRDDVEKGTVGLVEIEVEGLTTILPSLLAINEARASFIVEVA